MSYDVDLLVDGKIAQVKSHEEGGTYCIGGTTNAELNITYNYAEVYNLLPIRSIHIAQNSKQESEESFGIRWLNGKKAEDTIFVLEFCVNQLGTRRYSDYWAPTPGNAGYALSILLEWAKQHPTGIWDVQ